MAVPTDSAEIALLNKAQASMGWAIYGMPFIPSQTDFKESMPKLATKFKGEFFFSTCYEPEFVAELMYNGFLPMAAAGHNCEVITPKLHVNRSLVMFSEIPKPHGSTLKKAKKFEFSVDTCFMAVADGIVEQHGPNWFYPNLVKLLAKMNERQETGLFSGRVRVHSFELWLEGKLVAGEVGYSCGRVYTSMSGFTTADSAGTIQMYAMASHLKQLGFAVWDLGMQLGYKEKEFGARQYPRVEFLELISQHRDAICDMPISKRDRVNAKPLLAALRDSGAEEVEMA